MLRRAKSRVAGPLAALPLLALSSAAATSAYAQSTVQNDQVQIANLLSEQTLDVVTVSDGVHAATVATGNAASMTADSAPMDVRSSQSAQGSIYAHTTVNASDNMGLSSTTNTAATGNTGDLANVGNVLTAVTSQITGPTQITARGQIEAETSVAGDVTQSVQAIGNSQGLALTNAAAGARITQNNQAGILADGGAIIGASTGDSTVGAAAVGNNITTVGVSNSAHRVITDQANTANVTQASQFTAYGSTYLSTLTATASGNNLNATNQGSLLDVTSNQWNTSYVRAQAEETAFQFGGASVSAYASGNNALAGEQGPGLVLDNTQVNDLGGVEAIASFASAGSGFDATTGATAVGNASTGYACSACSGQVTVRNSQSSNADVSATSTTSVVSGRTITGVASAIGNTATYYVTKPGS